MNSALNFENDTLANSLSSWSSFSSRLNPPSAEVQVDIAGASHQGHVRKNNEDHYLAVKFQRSLETLCTNVTEGVLPNASFEEVGFGMVVADGMGGMAAGEVASRMALSKLVELVVNTPDWIMKFNEPEDLAQVMERITTRFRQVDDALKAQMERNRSLSGMGTTMTTAASLGAHLFIGHIGDSRAYLLREGKLSQLTRDHTLAQTLIDAGIANKENPAAKATRHVLTAALGASTHSDPQVQRLDLKTLDQILLCTDGLTEMVSEDIISSALTEANSSSSACQTLIDLALAAGGKDNVTVMLAKYQFPERRSPRKLPAS